MDHLFFLLPCEHLLQMLKRKWHGKMSSRASYLYNFIWILSQCDRRQSSYQTVTLGWSDNIMECLHCEFINIIYVQYQCLMVSLKGKSVLFKAALLSCKISLNALLTLAFYAACVHLIKYVLLHPVRLSIPVAKWLQVVSAMLYTVQPSLWP